MSCIKFQITKDMQGCKTKKGEAMQDKLLLLNSSAHFINKAKTSRFEKHHASQTCLFAIFLFGNFQLNPGLRGQDQEYNMTILRSFNTNFK